MAAVVDSEQCVGCGVCVDECPVEAIKLDGGVAVVDENECVSCGVCTGACPSEAITV